MVKKIATITILVLSILLVSLYVVTSTYSVIINVTGKEGSREIIDKITIRDLVTDNNGSYNDLYYEAKRELDITPEEANIIMESIPLNNTLEDLLYSTVDYRLHNKNKLTNEEIYNLIVSSINSDNTINEELKYKLVSKTDYYINDISEYLYDIKVSKEGIISWHT